MSDSLGNDLDAEPNLKTKESIGSRIHAVFVALSVCGLVGLSISYGMRPDMATALTTFPVWVWVFPGLLLLRLAWSHQASPRHKLSIAIVCLSWLAYLAVFAEEVRSLSRAVFSASSRPPQWDEMRSTGRALRVLSLNLALDLAGISDAKQYAPDIVLLQESPGDAVVERLAKELFGGEAGLAAGGDTAILARGKVVPMPLSRSSQLYLSQAQVYLRTGIQVEVISLHLATPPVRIDLWSPSAWTQLAEHRRNQRTQMHTIAEQVAHISADMPVIVGGDFNAPQGDAIFRSLKPRLRDSFREGGVGWGNTHDNNLPVLRIDQVWLSNHFGIREVRAHRTAHSDHRLVVCDVWIIPGNR